MNLWYFRVTLMALCLFIGLAAYAQSEDAASALTSQLQPLLPSNPEAGVAVGLIERDEETTFFVGNPDFSEDTRFEYGSITKVFTAILLAQLAEEGAVQLNESVNAYLPEEVQDAKWEEVSFEQLATHTAGLPRLPPNMTYSYFERNEADPYAKFDRAMLHEALQSVEVRESDHGFANYSNFGFGLLGTLLADTAGSSYAELIDARIFQPLAMDGATAEGSRSDSAAQPLASDGSETSVWTFDALAGTGIARGNLEDAMKFLEASIKACREDAPLSAANCRAQQSTGIKGQGASLQGLGWVRLPSPAGDIVFHGGGTGGFSSFFGFNVEKEVGLVLLANVAEVNVMGVGLEYLASLE